MAVLQIQLILYFKLEILKTFSICSLKVGEFIALTKVVLF